MKNIATFLAIAAIGSACQTPAFAEDPKPDLPLPESPVPPAAQPAAPKMLQVDQETLNGVAQYLQHTAVLYSVKCAENPNHWFCNAESLLVKLQKTTKPLDNKPACEAKKD